MYKMEAVDYKKWLPWILATIAIILIFQYIYGFASLQPSNIKWLMEARHDWGTHYLGWAFYKNEPWHFPLGKIAGYNYPVGANVGFTDSIPLLAIFFKLFKPFLSEDFQYFGIWLFICHLLAGYFTVLICRLFQVNWVITLAAVILVAANPVLIYRGMHPALCGHWMLLACIYLYFLDTNIYSWKKILFYQYLLLIFSSLINPYLCWMVLGFSLATPVRIWLYDRLANWRYFATYLVISLFSIWFLWLIVGMVSIGRKETLWINGSYGLYGLNLNSLYNSSGFSTWLPQLKWVSWHQYEGYMYLGFGMILLLLIYILYRILQYLIPIKPADPSGNRTGSKQSLVPLYILVFGFTIFSTTLKFTFDDKVLLNIPAPGFFKQLEEIFRASSRFFWVPFYLIFIFTIIGVARSRMPSWISSTLILLALVVQLYDIKPLLGSKNMYYGTYEPPMDNQDWIRLMKQFDEILFFPAFTAPPIRSMAYQDFSYLALKAGKPVNLAYLAREDGNANQRFSDSLTTVVESGKLFPRALYITTSQYLPHFSKALMSDLFTLNFLEGSYYIYSKNIKNDSLDALVARLNVLNQESVDSARQAIGKRPEFLSSYVRITKDNPSIHYNLESFNIGQGVISASGWALIDTTETSMGDSVFFTLSTGDKVYFGPVTTFQRADVARSFKRPYIQNAGLRFLAFTDSVQKGKYKVGMAIKDVKGRFQFQFLGKEVLVKISDCSSPEKISKLPAAGKIDFGIDLTQKDTVMIFDGWATLQGQDFSNCRTRLVLKGSEGIYSYITELNLRPDVTAYFKNKYNLDSSGYSIRISKNEIPKGDYQVGFIILDSKRNTESSFITDRKISIQ